MTKREYCEAHESTAYYSGFHGLEIKSIEYGPEDYIYCVSGAWGPKSKQGFHKLKIRYNSRGDAYIMLHGYRVPLADCIRMGAV